MTSCLHMSYTATQKRHALIVSPQVAAPGAESAVYNCLVLLMRMTKLISYLFSTVMGYVSVISVLAL